MHAKSIDKETIRIFWQAATTDKRGFWLSLLFPFGQICLGTIVPLLIGRIIASLASPTADYYHYIPHLIIIAAIGLVANRIGLTRLYRTQSYGIKRVQDMAVATLLRRSVGYHTNNIGGKLVSDASDYGQAFGQLFLSVFFTFVPFVATLLSGAVVVFIESVWLGLIITVTALFALIVGAYDSHNRRHLRKERLKASKTLVGHMADTIVNVQTVKTFAREDDELTRHREHAAELARLRAEHLEQASRTGNTRITTLLCLQLVFVLTLIHQVQRNPELLGIGIFAFSFTSIIFTRLFDSFTVIRQVEESLLQASSITKLLQTDIEISDAPDATDLVTQDGKIDIHNVSFTYEDEAKNRTVFQKLSLAIAPGERVGLVGPSGGGKSTLTRLLLRFDDIQKGTISIDGQDISRVTQTSLRKAISYVPQEPLLFHRSIKDNIAYGHPEASNEEIFEAAKKAHAHGFITELSQRYDTIVGERGVKLSGGQRQRIAIARAILKDAPILVLDEATSALDSESEGEIQKALWQLMKGRTALVVAHRLSTIQKMDRIVVLDKGKIIEQGTHQQLIAKNGLYSKLWSHQSGGFIEE